MTPGPRPVTRKDVKKFVDHCVILRAFWIHYETMFDGSDLKRELLESTAQKFFRDLNLMLIQHLILQICKLTDPESTTGRRNLTVQFLIKNADFSASPHELAKLKKIAAQIDAFRMRILPARHKFISHLDLDAALGRKSLGGASIVAWRRFWLDLRDFLAIMYKRYVDSRVTFYLDGIGGMSDASEVLKALKESTYFRALLDDETLTRKVADIAFNSKYHAA
jgi:hypothetical protein